MMRIYKPFLVAGAVAAAALIGPHAAQAQPRALSFSEAVNTAAGQSPDVAAAREAVGGAEARVAGAKARRLPVLSVSGNVFVWNEAIPLNLEFNPNDFADLVCLSPRVDCTPDMPNPPPMMAPQAGEPQNVRDQVTASASVTLTQPLSPLIAVGRLIRLEKANLAATRAQLDSTRLDAAMRAAEGYFGVLQAQAARDIAQQTLAQVESNLQNARALEAGGVLGRVDILRLEAARDQARQAVLEAETGARIAAGGLVIGIGLPEATQIEVRDDFPAEPPPPPWTPEQALEMARSARPERRVAQARTEQAARGADVARAGYLPNLLALARYEHTEGGGSFAIKDSAFVGLSLEWNVWDWGVTKSGVREAAAAERQARVALGSLDDQLDFDVRRRALEAKTVHETLGVARTGLAAAEEAYRIQKLQFDAGSATTTQVLDAEAEVARARISYALTRYQYFLALARLARATGQLPTVPLQGAGTP